MYEIEDDPVPTPALPGEAILALDLDEVVDRVAEDLVQHAFNCVRRFGDFHLALSGDPRFDPLYRRLMYDPRFRWLPWRRTHLWCVEEAMDRRHEQALRELIVQHADLPAEQFHPIPVHAPAPAEAYGARVREVLGWRERGQDRLDYVLLPLDAEGGVPGLFPGSPLIGERERLYGTLGAAGAARVVVAPGFVNAARLVAVLAEGELRAPAIRRIAAGDLGPVAELGPLEGELRWYLDLEACPPDP